MGDWTTLSVRKRTAERFHDEKDAMDAADPNTPDLTSDEFVNTLLDTLDHARDGGYDSDDSGEAEFPDELYDQLQRIEAAATTAEDRTGSIESTLEAMGGRR